MSIAVKQIPTHSSFSKNSPPNTLQKKGRPQPCYANADERRNYSNAKIEAQTVARFVTGETGEVNNTLYIAVPKKTGAYFRIHPDHKTSSSLHPNILSEKNMTRLQNNIETRKFSTRIIPTNKAPGKSLSDFSFYKMVISLPTTDSLLSTTLGRASPGWDASFNPDTIQKKTKELKAEIKTKKENFTPAEPIEKKQSEVPYFIYRQTSIESISSISDSEDDELNFTDVRFLPQFPKDPPFSNLPAAPSSTPKVKKTCCEKLMACFYWRT